MFDKLSIPAKGEPPKASWGAGVANRLNELCAMSPARTLVRDGQTGTGFAPLPANMREHRTARFLHPYLVKWEQSANDGNGSWIIWLPGEGILSINGKAHDPSKDLEAVGEPYPEGWYLLDVLDAESGGTLYLNISKPSEGEGESDDEEDEEPVEIEFAAEASEDEGVMSVAICEASVDAERGVRSVRAFVTSAIVIGGSGVTSVTGDDEGSETISGDIEISGQLDPDLPETTCGIIFTTVSERSEEEFGQARKARIIADLKDRDPQETKWGVHEIQYYDENGKHVKAHVLSCADIKIGAGGGGGGGGGEDDPDDPESGGVDSLIGDVPGSVKVSGDVILSGASGSGLCVKTGNGGVAIDLVGREALNGCSGSFGLRELTFVDEDGDEQIYHVLACGDIDLPSVEVKRIVAGPGVSVSESDDGRTITISATGGSGGGGSGGGGGETSGFTGDKIVVTNVVYNAQTHKLQMKLETLKFKNGLLKSVDVPAALTDVTTAVEETV